MIAKHSSVFFLLNNITDREETERRTSVEEKTKRCQMFLLLFPFDEYSIHVVVASFIEFLCGVMLLKGNNETAETLPERFQTCEQMWRHGSCWFSFMLA